MTFFQYLKGVYEPSDLPHPLSSFNAQEQLNRNYFVGNKGYLDKMLSLQENPLEKISSGYNKSSLKNRKYGSMFSTSLYDVESLKYLID